MRMRPEYDMQTVGRNLRRLRERMNLTVEEVREYLCLGSVQAVYKYESGKSYPQADTMFALMELYHADLHDIAYSYEEEEDRESSSSFWEKRWQMGAGGASVACRELLAAARKIR